MTVGDLKIETLKKMFLNSQPIDVGHLSDYESDKKYNTYLNMFNQAANEGLLICMRRGREIIKSHTITCDGSTNSYDLDELVDDYYKIYKLFINGKETNNYVFKTDNILETLPLKENDTITLYYEAYPELLDSNTANNDVLENHIENLMILPLYIASELYKDDDISLATMYRNEFEALVDNKYSKDNNTHFESVNGWY